MGNSGRESFCLSDRFSHRRNHMGGALAVRRGPFLHGRDVHFVDQRRIKCDVPRSDEVDKAFGKIGILGGECLADFFFVACALGDARRIIGNN
jgi:hypothetical protein